jgi:purine nucleosidase
MRAANSDVAGKIDVAQRIIFDTDIGTDVDDAYALALLVNSPEVEIEAVTTVWADPLLRARIARTLLNSLGKSDIPVAVGESTAMEGGRPAFLLGHEGNCLSDGDKGLEVSGIPAAELIGSLLRKYPHEIKVLLMGPQTNLGRMLAQEPELAMLVKEFVIMGGLPFYGLKEMERIGERPLETNFAADPQAVRIVFECDAPITLVGANVTMPVILTQEHIERIRKRRTPATDLLHDMTVEWLRMIGLNETPMHDPLAVAAAFTLDFLDTMMLNVTIETKGELTAGLPVVNRCDNEEWNRVRVATDVRGDEFMEFMLERILT